MGDPSAERGTVDPATANRYGPPPPDRGGAPGRGKGSAAPPRDPAKDALAQKRAQLVERFKKRVESAFSGHPEKAALKAAYDDATAIVAPVKDGETLAALMSAYLVSYEAHAANREAVGYYRSDLLFQNLFEQIARVGDAALFEKWDGALTGKPADPDGQRLKKRYEALPVQSKAAVEAVRRQQREKARQAGSLLDLLKTEYARVNHRPPRTFDDLYGFAPRPQVQKSAVDAQISLCRFNWNAVQNNYTVEGRALLDGTLSGFADAVRAAAQKDLMMGFQIVQLLQQRLRHGAPGTPALAEERAEPKDQGILLGAMYGIACTQLLAVVMSTKMFQRNADGFTREEVDYLSRPLKDRAFEYASNIRGVLEPKFRGPGVALQEMQLLLGATALVTSKLPQMKLVDRDQTLKTQAKWLAASEVTKAIKAAALRGDTAGLTQVLKAPENAAGVAMLEEICATELVIDNPQFLGKGLVRPGNRVGTHLQFGDYTLVYVEDRRGGDIYVELAALRPLLFKVDLNFIKDRFYRANIYEVYRGTVGMLYITEGIFLAIGFMPVLIEAGFAGLIYEIGVAVVSDEVGEQVAKIDPKLGFVVQNLIQLFAPRPHFGPKIEDPEGLALKGERGVAERGTALPKIERAEAIGSRALTAEEHAAAQAAIDKVAMMQKIPWFEAKPMFSILPIRRLLRGRWGVDRGLRMPAEWRKVIESNPKIAEMLNRVDNPRLVPLEGQLKADWGLYQADAMGTRYELWVDEGKTTFKIDGFIVDDQGRTFIGDAKFTGYDAYGAEPMASYGEGGPRDPTESPHFQFLDHPERDKVKSIREQAAFAKRNGLDGLVVVTNTDFLSQTYRQVTDDLDNVFHLFHEFSRARRQELRVELGLAKPPRPRR